MEQNLPIIAKKFWHIIRVVYLMLRKGISKAKLLADLNIMMKRGKIASKAAMHNLVFHHHHSDAAGVSYPTPLNEYEFSCSNTPAHAPAFRLPFHLSKRKPHSHAPPQPSDAELFAAAVEIAAGRGVAPSPGLPGFGRTPMVRQLRITDSPFPVTGVEEDSHVDEAAEKFIMKFYKDLRRQDA